MISLFSGLSERTKKMVINIVIATSILVVLGLLLYPLSKDGVVWGDDFPYHISRIDGLAKAISDGTALSGIRTNYFAGYGYGTGFFYCDFFIVLPALFRNAGFSLEFCYELLLALIIVGMAGSSWIAFKEITRNKVAAAMGTILFVSSHYFMLNLFSRSALGESIAMVFLPLVVSGLYNLVRDHYSKPYLLVVGIIGTCLSHVISTVFCVVLCLVVFFLHIKTIRINKLFSKVVYSAIFALGVTAFYWISMLEQMFAQKYFFHTPWIRIYEQSTSFVGSLGDDRYSIGCFLVLFVVAISLFAEKNSIKKNLVFLVCPMIGLILLSLASFWLVFEKIFGFMQFPWRLLSLITISIVVYIVNIFGDLLKKGISQKHIVILFVMVTLLNIVMNQDYYAERIDDIYRIEDNQDVIMKNMIGGGGEWRPASLIPESLILGEKSLTDKGTMIEGERVGLTYTVMLSEDAAYLDVPFIYYKGYSAYNQTQKCWLPVSASDGGLVRIELDNMAGDVIKVQYDITLAAWVGYAVSIIACGMAIVLFIKKCMIKKRQEK